MFSISLIRKFDELAADLKNMMLDTFGELEQCCEVTVTKTEFNEFKDIVKNIAEAQESTEKELLDNGTGVRALKKN